jgi:hypothetical protein
LSTVPWPLALPSSARVATSLDILVRVASLGGRVARHGVAGIRGLRDSLYPSDYRVSRNEVTARAFRSAQFRVNESTVSNHSNILLGLSLGRRREASDEERLALSRGQTTLRRVAKSILRSRVWVKLLNFWRSPR